MNNPVRLMNLAADNIRVLAASMVEKAKSGHPGGAMGGADYCNALYAEALVFDPDDPQWKCRDRFYLDPGHMSPMLYSVLALSGFFSIDDLRAFRQWGSITPGHPERDLQRGIENTSGPLGQGHTYAVGAAIAAKMLYARTGNPGFEREKIYAYISDGGVQEEVSQGAGRLAGHLGLNNLIMFYDSNDVQLSTMTAEVISEDTAQKYRAWNWNVIEIDGNDIEQIRTALAQAQAETQRPTLIIGHTVMGKGARRADGSSFENHPGTHGSPLGADAYVQTVRNLGGDPDNGFDVRPEVQAIYEARREELRNIVAERRAEENAWAEAHPELAQELEDWFAGRLPQLPWNEVEQKPNQSTRQGSKVCLQMLSKYVKNMLVSSADLCNSDKTDGFLAHSTIIQRDDFSGGFLQAGVSELTMACVCIGAMLHGGIVSACGTFFVFSDYMKPAIRMAALMEVPIKFIWTHDAFRVGEDGPTHEPVEQEAQIRLMEKLKNHSGRDSVRVFRPCDVHATTECWKQAMENTDTPTALIFSRQNIQDLPHNTDYSGVARGAYAVIPEDNPDVVLVGSGSEISTLAAAGELLQKDGIRYRVVSCPSEGLFRRQPIEYQEALIPSDVKTFGLTSGLPVNLVGLVGSHGRIYGLDSFGFSAPYTVLDEKLGFTGEHIYQEIKDYLNGK
ncbi:MAG: transketolase [Bacteroidaceae bacterium]|nr:transketolase [Bacteroidaceae bacterium]